MTRPSLYERIGADQITDVITEFYRRAFEDPIIGHFFFAKDRAELTAKQISFAARMLGATEVRYEGLPLKLAHQGLPLTLTHFRRRQVLMADVLSEKNLAADLAAAWLALEESLRGLIINSAGACNT